MLNTYIARGTLTFTAAVVLIAGLNLASGRTTIEYSFLLEIMGFLVCLEILDFAFSKADFRSRVLYLAGEFAAMYLCYLTFAWFGHWFGFSPDKFALGTAAFVVLFAAVHLYYHFELQWESREINSRLKKKNTERRM